MGFFQTVKQMGIFVVCAQMILHFKPTESYGKYIRLLASMMVLAQLISPVLALLGKGNAEVLRLNMDRYEQEMEKNAQEIESTCASAEKLLDSMTLEEVKSRINSMDAMDERGEKRERGEKETLEAEDAGDSGEGVKVEKIEVRIDG